MSDLKKWARKMLPALARDAENLLDSLTTPGTVVSLLFELGQQWEHRRNAHRIFRVLDQVLVKPMKPSTVTSRALKLSTRKELPEGTTVGDYIASQPSYEAIVYMPQPEHGGVLVRHHSGEVLGWAWHEIEPADQP